jgi:hypothetical protein
MPAPQKLTKQSEERILDALEEVRNLLDDGMHPDDAIYKAAAARKIPAGHVQIMVNAVNTGRTNEQRMSAAELFKKAEEFPLANAHKILSRLYPDRVKTAAEEYKESVVSAEYNRKPARLVEEAKAVEKRAYVLPPLTDKRPEVNPKYSDLPDVQFQKALSACKRAEYVVHETRREAQAAYDRCVKLAADLTDYFKVSTALPLSEVRYNSSALFGNKATLLLDLVGVRLPKTVQEKRASQLNPVDVRERPYSLIRENIDAGRTYLDKKAAYEAALVGAKEVAEKAMSPFDPDPSLGGSVLGGPSSRTKFGGIFGDFMSGAARQTGTMAALHGIGKNFPGSIKDPDSTEKDDLKSLLDPGHESTIRNIQAEAMLNDLMANDDIIKSHDPQEVMDAYNEVSQMSPHMSTQKAIMRNYMRERLAGGAQGLDSFKLQSILDHEGKLRDQHKVPGEQLDIMKTLGALPKGDAGGEKKSSVLD